MVTCAHVHEAALILLWKDRHAFLCHTCIPTSKEKCLHRTPFKASFRSTKYVNKTFKENMWPYSAKCSPAAGSILTPHYIFSYQKSKSSKSQDEADSASLAQVNNPADMAQTRSTTATLAARESNVTPPDLMWGHQVRHYPEPGQSLQLCQSHPNSKENTSHSKRPWLQNEGHLPPLIGTHHFSYTFKPAVCSQSLCSAPG